MASEVLYYLEPAALDDVLAHLDETLSAGGHLLAVHYRGATNYPLSGDEVHARLAAWRGARRTVRHEEELFVLELFEKT